MPNPYSILFQPLTIKGVTLHNRVVLPPMVTNRDLNGAEARAWYRQFADGGAGTVIVEAARIPQLGDKLTADSLRPLAESIHAGGAAAVVQLFWPPPERRDRPDRITLDDIGTALGQFEAAAATCRDAGFDGVEPHGAHGFLLNQFFSPRYNTRKDAYGGGLEGRMRLGLEVAAASRAGLGPEPLLFYRHTPNEFDSYGTPETVEFCRRLVAAGVDVLDLSPSSEQAPGDRAAQVKALGIAPVIAVGRLGEPDRALEALREGRCDLVAVGRGQIADPDWANKLADGEPERIEECVLCDQGCFGNLREGKPIECIHR
ncbi:MAG: NADH:flavin oxidoreductase [Armatimonadetes bacterium]|nr:NADH:flavin oxidoreductase [Armatimonadota bacterium]